MRMSAKDGRASKSCSGSRSGRTRVWILEKTQQGLVRAAAGCQTGSLAAEQHRRSEWKLGSADRNATKEALCSGAAFLFIANQKTLSCSATCPCSQPLYRIWLLVDCGKLLNPPGVYFGGSRARTHGRPRKLCKCFDIWQTATCGAAHIRTCSISKHFGLANYYTEINQKQNIS